MSTNNVSQLRRYIAIGILVAVLVISVGGSVLLVQHWEYVTMLESQGLLQSAWRIESDRPRRYYMLSDEGRQLLPRLKEEWTGIVAMMKKML